MGEKLERKCKKKGHKDFYQNGNAGSLWAGGSEVVFSHCPVVSAMSFIDRKCKTKTMRSSNVEALGTLEFPRLHEDFR